MAIKKTVIIEADTTQAVKSAEELQNELDELVKLQKELKRSAEDANDPEKAKEYKDELKKVNRQIEDNREALAKQNKIEKELEATQQARLDAIDKATFGLTAKIREAIQGVRAFAKSFGVLRGAVIATGIGALLVTITSLVQWFKRTEEGAQSLRVVMAGLGAAVDVVLDLASKLGKTLFEVFTNPKKALKSFADGIKNQLINRFEGLLELIPQLGKAITLLFEGEFSEAGQVAVDAVAKVTLGVEDLTEKVTDGVGKSVQFFKDLGTEIVADSKAAIALEKALNKVIVQERELRVRRAEATAEIEKQKFIAEDTTKTFEERLTAAQKAFELEQEIVDAQVKNEQERLRILEEQAALSDSNEETLEALADQRVKVAELEAASATRQIELNNKINSIKREQQAIIEQNAAAEEEAARQAEENEKKASEMREAQRKKEQEEKKRQALEEIELQKTISNARIDISANALGVIEGFTKEGSDLQKAVGVAQATIDTYKAANNALATVPAPFNFAAAAVAVAAGLSNVSKILSVDASGGSVSAPSIMCATKYPNFSSFR